MKPINLVLSIILLAGCAAHQAATLEVSKRESPLNSDNLSNSVIDENTEPTTFQVRMLKHSDPLVRRMAVYELANLRDKRVSHVLLDLFDDVDPDVQETAIARIGDLDDPVAIPPLVQLLKSHKTSHQCASMISLQNLSYTHRNNELLIQAVLDSLQSDLPEIRVRAAWILGHINSYDLETDTYTTDPRVIKPLIQALNDPNPRVISAAANSLGAQGITQASTPIFECFIRCRTAWQLIRAAGYKEDETDEDYSTSKVQEYQDLQGAAAHCLNALVRLQATRFGPMLAEMSSELELDWLLIEDKPTVFQVSLTRAIRVLVHDKDPELKRRLKWMEEVIADHKGKGRNFIIKE
ncbi:MAG: HEAT repeat domain-containing protein [Planctomycetota bacterium]|jgi:hypothetical protein